MHLHEIFELCMHILRISMKEHDWCLNHIQIKNIKFLKKAFSLVKSKVTNARSTLSKFELYKRINQESKQCSGD